MGLGCCCVPGLAATRALRTAMGESPLEVNSNCSLTGWAFTTTSNRGLL